MSKMIRSGAMAAATAAALFLSACASQQPVDNGSGTTASTMTTSGQVVETTGAENQCKGMAACKGKSGHAKKRHHKVKAKSSVTESDASGTTSTTTTTTTDSPAS